MILIKCGVRILISVLIFKRLHGQVLLQSLTYVVLLRYAKGWSDLRVVRANTRLIVREIRRLYFQVYLAVNNIPRIQANFLKLGVHLLKRFLVCIGLQSLVRDRAVRCYVYLTLPKQKTHRSLVTCLGLSKFLGSIAY